MIGERISHYRILEEIGKGGMGIVYLAHDERLDRSVALKVLPRGALGNERARTRFRKEALTLSKLNHPNIETVHDFNTQAGVDFLVMEYVPGTTLNTGLRKGSLGEEKIVALAVQLVGGLAAAHDLGIVHRDLKPANLRVTPDGRLKILDFGLATHLRPADDATTETLRGHQAIVGTLPYMSPEQVRSERIDGRADLYAVGVILYEMATARRPFQETTMPRLTEAILHQAPVPPRTLNPHISPDLERIILKCLDKHSEHRYQSAKELGVDLNRCGLEEDVVRRRPYLPRVATALIGVLGAAVLVWAAVLLKNHLMPVRQPDSGRIMLAALPFNNLSGDPSQEYFSDGLTEEMIAQLGRINPQGLGVIARSSVVRCKNSKMSIDEIAKTLGVDYVLEGGVRRVNDRVRITAHLIQTNDQTYIWTQGYDGEATDVLNLQSKVARAIARAIQIKMSPGYENRFAVTRRVDSYAYEAYLKGRYFWNRRNREDLARAIGYFEQAIEQDPEFAPAYAGLADTYILKVFHDTFFPAQLIDRARAAAHQALRLEPDLGEALTSLAHIMFLYDWDWEAAGREYQHAIDADPGYATAHQWYGLFLLAMGRPGAAQRQLEQALDLDPLSISINNNLAGVHLFSRDYDRAIERFRKSLDLEPDYIDSRLGLGEALLHSGRNEEALQEIARAGRLDPDYAEYLVYMGLAYARLGQRDQTMHALQHLEDLDHAQPISPGLFAYLHAALDQEDAAFERLGQAYEERRPMMAWLRADSDLDSLRSDPRFQDLMRRMNFPPVEAH